MCAFHSCLRLQYRGGRSQPSAEADLLDNQELLQLENKLRINCLMFTS